MQSDMASVKNEIRNAVLLRVLQLLNEREGAAAVREILLELKRFSGCDSVGMRLREQDHLHCYEINDETGKLIDSAQSACTLGLDAKVSGCFCLMPALRRISECVINGRYDPGRDFFTCAGSFWTNSITALSASVPRQSWFDCPTGFGGYEAIAIIPLKSSDETIGVLEFRQRIPGAFDAELVEFLESLGQSLGIAVAHDRAHEALEDGLRVARDQAQQLAAYEASQRRQSELVIDEINHRIRNNLAAIAGLLEMELNSCRAHLPKEVALREAAGRIQVIAAVHELLHGQSIHEVDLQAIARRIARIVEDNFLAPEAKMVFSVQGATLRMGSKAATGMALVINELLVNAAKHALCGRTELQVRMSFTICDDFAEIEVRDDGPGFPADFDPAVGANLGLELVDQLLRFDLCGEWKIGNNAGAMVILKVPSAGLCTSETSLEEA